MSEPRKYTIDDVMIALQTVQEATGLSITRIDEKIDALDRRFEHLQADMDRRFDLVVNRFDAVDTRFDAVDTRFDRLEALIRSLKPKRKRPTDRE